MFVNADILKVICAILMLYNTYYVHIFCDVDWFCFLYIIFIYL